MQFPFGTGSHLLVFPPLIPLVRLDSRGLVQRVKVAVIYFTMRQEMAPRWMSEPTWSF